MGFFLFLRFIFKLIYNYFIFILIDKQKIAKNGDCKPNNEGLSFGNILEIHKTKYIKNDTKREYIKKNQKRQD